ncbi:hypothetical protein SAMN05216327_10252 [Dyadobacter sp. SG02]|uniref:hypothetical protein n=1 Tax=Dyadobacter sp. SG02 TaxID=1855291 RepID=UPI0008AC9534|nr:hypothetical protein [Dyadobacter sp. SG02]SEI49939.1 hypothetical protein SAMN05216327_10252 [Dyadobacter sp. SG02]
MKTFCSLLLLLCLIGGAQAADPPIRAQVAEQTRIKILKASLEFLATQGKDEEKRCEKCGTADELLEFGTASGIPGADNFMKRWRKRPIDTTAAGIDSSLTAFRNVVFAGITTGAEKEKRKEWPAYAGYEQELDQIGADASASLAKLKPVPKTPPSGSPKGGENEADIPDYSFVYMAALSILLLLVLWLFLRMRKIADGLSKAHAAVTNWRGNQEQASVDIESLRNELGEMRRVQGELRHDNALLEAAFKNELEKNSRLVTETKSDSARSTPTTEQKSQVVKKFARYADQGDGFSVSDLLDEEDGETIFELSLTSSQKGFFRIATNAAAQRYALSNSRYFLSNTCEYEDLRSVNSTIHTVEPGELRLSGNKWQITQQVKIRFS